MLPTDLHDEPVLQEDEIAPLHTPSRVLRGERCGALNRTLRSTQPTLVFHNTAKMRSVCSFLHRCWTHESGVTLHCDGSRKEFDCTSISQPRSLLCLGPRQHHNNSEKTVAVRSLASAGTKLDFVCRGGVKLLRPKFATNVHCGPYMCEDHHVYLYFRM